MMETDEVVEALGALAQPSRLELFRLLVQRGPEGLAAGDIASRLGIPATTLSFHLAQMTRAGLLRAQRRGRSIVYAADYGRMQDLLAFLTLNCCQETSCSPALVRPKERKSHGVQARDARRRR